MDESNDSFKRTVLTDEVEGGLGTNLGDWVDVVTAKEDTKINKL